MVFDATFNNISAVSRTMALLTMIFTKLNVPLAKHKTMSPLTMIEYLGIILDSDKMEARLPEEKVNRYHIYFQLSNISLLKIHQHFIRARPTSKS
jgi:hypothetical protein